MKVGLVPYLNILPLVYFLRGYSLIQGSPYDLCIQYSRGDLEVSFLPTFELLKGIGGFLLQNVAIASYGKVASVLFFLNKDIHKVRYVGIDSSSLSSHYLLKLLLKDYYGLTCHFKVAESKNLTTDPDLDAYLLIGDIALYHRQYKKDFLDLGYLWSEWTNLPFVFGVWVFQSKNDRVAKDLLDSKKLGLSCLDEIVQAATYPDKVFLKQYYQDYLSYDFGEQEQRGLSLYQEKLYQNNFLKAKIPLQYF